MVDAMGLRGLLLCVYLVSLLTLQVMPSLVSATGRSKSSEKRQAVDTVSKSPGKGTCDGALMTGLLSRSPQGQTLCQGHRRLGFSWVLEIEACSHFTSYPIAVDGVFIRSLKVNCKVTSRFAHYVVTSQVVNTASEAKEVAFDVEIPKTAFISDFAITADGSAFIGDIKDKVTAWKQYRKAAISGENAGLVSQDRSEGCQVALVANSQDDGRESELPKSRFQHSALNRLLCSCPFPRSALGEADPPILGP
ncbi:Inter-alpha-trypsin inhibitor heavy chain H1 [Saguinus oedipus]|uniref:Inter-alpha-trypsin inhibitor heavy chain H1 n=1 Tax=Saguinus oedipus TaxID=9490 RepID=A0ABQ9U2G8_SAGOE|nr:Inter-alpha-trypsin inhibitor heavy chain H1 [Saguinus oedipus]